MARKTNKTSHVLNLITNGNTSAADSPASESASPDAGLPQEAALEPAASAISREAAMALGAASEEHAAALRENAAALRENAAALHEVSVSVGNEAHGILPVESRDVQPEETLPEQEPEEREKAPVLQQKAASADFLESAGTVIQEEGRRQEQEPIPVPAFTGEKKVIVVDASESDKLSDEIRELLEEHVEREEAERTAEADIVETEEQEPEPVLSEKTEAEPSTEPEKAAELSVREEESGILPESEENSGDVHAEEPEPEILPSASEPEKAPEPEIAPEPEKSYRIVNVMEGIMKRKNLKADMKKYGVCTCSRCCADVLAFSLTNLPAKYVVVDENPEAPIIGFYENKLKVAILTEFMKACILVKENPRH